MTPYKVNVKIDSVSSLYQYPLGDYQVLDVDIHYSLGGINYFTGNTNPRGYYMSVTPCTITDHGGWSTRSCVWFGKYSGVKTLLEPANRFSKSAFQKVVDHYKNDWDMIQKLVENIKARSEN
jgi:hypothetical protein